MRYAIAAIVVTGALAVIPVVGFAAAAPQAKSAVKQSQTKLASRATTGVVKSIDATTLVITRSGKSAGEMTFALKPSTHRAGTVAVGSPVSVRYRQEGKSNIATAITVQHPKQQTTAHKMPSA